MANVKIKRYSGSAWVDINPKTTIGQVINLSSQLANMQIDIDGKLAKTGKAADSDLLDGQHGAYYRNSENIFNPDYKTGSVPPLVKSLFDMTRPDRTAFLPADQIIIEQSVDAGVTWTDAGIDDVTKRRLFSGERPYIRLPLINGVKNTNAMIRVTITGMKYNQSAAAGETDRYNFWNSTYVQATERYCSLDEGWAWVGSNSDRLWLRVERATGGYPNSWATVREAWLTGWDGGNYFKLDGSTFGGGTTQTGNSWNWRLTFRTATTANDFDNSKMSTYIPTNPQTIRHLKLTGQNVWTAPNKLMYHDHLYGWDIDQNAKFPAEIYASNNQKVYHPGNKPTAADIGAAPTAHEHMSIEVKVGQDAGTSKLSVFQDIDGAGYTTKTGLELFRQSGSSQSMLEISKPYGSTSSIDFITNEADAFNFNKPVKVGDTNVSLAGHKHTWSEITSKPSFATVATSGSYNDLTNKPTIPAAQVAVNWNSTSGITAILNKPNLATVATSGSYNDLSNKPIIPSAQVQSNWNATTGMGVILNKPNLATVATSGSYNDLSNKPTIPSIPSVMDTTEGNTGTATTQRTINAKNLKEIILNHSPAGARTPTGHGHSKSDITNFDSEVLALSPAGARPASDVSAWAKKSSLALSDVPTISIAKGGTGATTALAARANLGLGNGATATNVIRQVSFQNNILTIEVV